ncbi:uncharacterized protein [Tenebrio molitor]|uniref:uncharacterized protein n=1 Tax=Tenebrio molitor TaxID=7067 RepID=UPI0036247F8C
MPKQKISLREKILQWTSKKDLYEIKSTREMFCKACGKLFICEKKCHLQQHEQTAIHKENIMTPLRQTLLTQNLEESANSTFNMELCNVFLAANIPWHKLQNPAFQNFLTKYCGRKIPDESTLRKNYLPKCYKDTIDRIRNELDPFNIWVSVDETTDALGRYVANCLVGKLSEDEPGKSYLLASKQLERTNHETIARFVNQSLEILWSTRVFAEKFLLFVTDGAPYMIKSGRHLKVFYPKIVHVTCLAHALNLVAEKIRYQYEDVDNLISNVKKIFVKAPLRVEMYKEKLKEMPLPPQPILTRWGTWLQAAMFYSEHFNSIKEVVMSFDGSSAVAIQKAQSIMKKPGIKNQLIYVRSNFKIICESITQLEKNGLPLTDSIKIVENVFTSLKKSPGPVAAVALKKLEDVTEKNPGYKFLLELARIFRGEDVPEHDTKMEEIYYKFAPITSCEVERSFSKYKSILVDNRQCFKVENLEQYLVCNVNT